MTHRERVLDTFGFRQTDRTPYDIMESHIWPELMAYFTEAHGLTTPNEVYDFLDTDFRWGITSCLPPQPDQPVAAPTATVAIHRPPLADAITIADIEAIPLLDPEYFQPPDFAAFRDEWPNHAVVACGGWMPLFWAACDAFGMEEALIKMACEQDIFEAYIRRRQESTLQIHSKTLAAARGYADIYLLTDDYAGNDSTMMSPESWRKLIKPYLAKEIELVHKNGMYAMLHSCGSVRSILPDFIDIGLDAHLVFQTSARGMDAESIAGEFGGKLVFYGGIDCQHLLTFGTPDDVRAEVRKNVKAFSKCGGYIVANCHHYISNIQPENMMAMYEAARATQTVSAL